jgi:hypothetical protein
LADTKITGLPIASISAGDPIPFAKISTSVTSAINFQDFENAIMNAPVITSPSIIGTLYIQAPFSVMGVGVSSVTGNSKMVLSQGPVIASPSITGNAEAAGNITVASTLFISGRVGSGVGYATTVSSTVAQANVPLGKQQSVICHSPVGLITIASTATASSVISTFALTNSVIGASDLLVINHISGGTIGRYAFNATAYDGGANISIINLRTTAASEAPVIRFAVIKA